MQASSSHSRLVTTKLTATPQPSTTTGPGWSRASSATPPVANSASTGLPNGNTSNVNGSSSANHSNSIAVQSGGLHQPQPRSSMSMPGNLKDAGGKPVWGNVRGASGGAATRAVQNDFPTAAEVAQGACVSLVDGGRLMEGNSYLQHENTVVGAEGGGTGGGS